MSPLFSRVLILAPLVPGMLFMLMASCNAQAPPFNTVEQPGDPARWYQEEMTPRGYLLTLKKEAHAVHDASVKECRQLNPGDKQACKKSANEQLKKDLADAQIKAGR